MQHPDILKNNINHLSKNGPPPFLHSDTNLVLRNVLVHSVERNHVLVVTGKLIWLLFLNILSFNYAQTTNKFLRFRKFRRSYMYTSLLSFKPTTMKCRLLFLLDAHCWKRPYSIFCCCLSVTIVHWRNLFLLSTFIAQILLTPRRVSRRKDVKYLFINIW